MKVTLILCLALAVAYAANETTEAPETTTAAEPTTTSAAPTTTTEPPKTTTAPSDYQTFKVMNSTGNVCLVMMTRVFNVSVNCPNGKTREFAIGGPLTRTTGTCGDEADTITIKELAQDIELVFTLKDTFFQLTNATVDTKEDECKVKAESFEMNEFRAPAKNIYRCNARRSVAVGSNVTMILEGVKLQAFRTSSSDTLEGTEYICMEDSTTSDIVPIAVGCALAGLIVIVLVAYVIGRLRRRPYEIVE